MRASLGDVVTANGPEIATSMLKECAEIAASVGFAPRPQALGRAQAMLTAAGSALMASMLRDIERGAQTEAEHILGDLVRRRKGATPSHSLLRIAYAHTRSYEIRRAREAGAN
jgi:2-dehydropantoate 2-reductase